jgi:hypothetical protein
MREVFNVIAYVLQEAGPGVVIDALFWVYGIQELAGAGCDVRFQLLGLLGE